ncbi:NUDIX hydrolase [Streptomyces sp. NBC_00083]|uniref:NUDIX hydrolase n=1 Tax=Streptomyces sp. NBC_00083 TaxID=2975647 RepID=UPI00224D21EF|nr:NUDIX domain-containing protein [Streptomyces sp. NBC_00083]MCX5387334.1 NUDIX domain-containing protein [Streptomyces sp. NBC_00083]
MADRQAPAHARTSRSYVLGATCVAFNDLGQVLVGRRRSPERWELPGGLVDPGEAFHDAAVRETYEETGVHVEVHGLVGVYQHVSRGILAGIFIATAVSGEPGPTAESSAAEWTDVEDALARLHPLYRPRLEDALAARDSATFRVHEGTTVLSLFPAAHLAGRHGSDRPDAD